MADQADNLFNQTAPAASEAPVITPAADPLADKLKAIVGPDGKPKYANPLVAIDALSASQAHIQRLEAEAAERATELERLRDVERTATSMEAVLERLKPTSPTATPVSGLDEQAVERLLERSLENRGRQATAQANVKKVNDILTEKFKDKSKDVVAAKAAELGMTTQELGELSSRSPALVLQLFGSTAPVTASPTNTSVHLPGSPPAPEAVARPEKSLISGVGATDANRKAKMAEIRAAVHKRLGVEV